MICKVYKGGKFAGVFQEDGSLPEGCAIPMKEWAKHFDPDYDEEIDGPAGTFIAAHTYAVNIHTAVIALTGLPSRRDHYDAVSRWLMTLPLGMTPLEMEEAWSAIKKDGDWSRVESLLEEVPIGWRLVRVTDDWAVTFGHGERIVTGNGGSLVEAWKAACDAV